MRNPAGRAVGTRPPGRVPAVGCSPPSRPAAAVMYRPIVRYGRVVGYLWAVGDTAGYWARAGGGADRGVRAYWMWWLSLARERGLSTGEAMASWNPAWEFPRGTPATGPANEIADLGALRALAEGTATFAGYASETSVLVRHHPAVRDGVPVGHLWASIDELAAGFVPAADLPDGDPASPAWHGRLAESAAAGLTPSQALHALRDAPDDGAAGRLIDPLGQSLLPALRRA